jgi:hypothetical protein
MNHRQLKLELIAGIAPQTLGCFWPGKPTGSISVGSRAAWVIEAPGVQPFHAYLYFDGNDLWATGLGDGAQISIDGTPVLGGWAALSETSVLELGQARLKLTLIPAEASSYVPAPEPIAEGPPPPHFRIAAATRRKPSPAPLPGAGPGGTMIIGADQLPSFGQPAAAVRSASSGPLGTMLINAPGTSPDPAVAPTYAAPSRPAPIQAPPVHAAGASGVLQPMGATKPAEAVNSAPLPGETAPELPSERIEAPPQRIVEPPLARTVLGEMPGAHPNQTFNPADRGFIASESATSQAGPSKLNFWAQSTLTQKVILVLVPFAMVAVWLIVKPKKVRRPASSPPATTLAETTAAPSPAPPPVGADQATSVPTPSADGTASSTPTSAASSAPALPAPPVVPVSEESASDRSAKREPATKPADGKQGEAVELRGEQKQERDAAKAVFAGKHAEALAHYQALASAHPDRPVFAATARILKARMAEIGETVPGPLQ